MSIHIIYTSVILAQSVIYPEERKAILNMEAKLKKIEESITNIDEAKQCMYDLIDIARALIDNNICLCRC